MKIKLFVMDVDGTMTDGRFTVDCFGNETKTFNVKDGMAINILKSKNILTAILTNHKSEIVRKRAKQLGIDFYNEVAADKMLVLNNIIEENSLTLDQVAYIGDDLNDLCVLSKVGISGCPNDASEVVKKECDFVSKCSGGCGCIRDFVEALIRWGNI